MKPTGRINPFTQEEIMEIEPSDINWRNVPFSKLSLAEKADFCSLINELFLSKSNIDRISKKWDEYLKIYLP